MDKEKLKWKVFSKIENEKIDPIKESYFENKNRIAWLMISAATIIAIVFFSFAYDDSMDFFSMRWTGRWYSQLFLPNIFWIALMAIMFFFWIWMLKDTKVWYRRSYAEDIVIWIAIVFVWSFVFRWFWIWYYFHSAFVDSFPSFSNTLYMSDSWNDPSSGLLAWTIKSIDKFWITLESLDWKTWKVDTSNSFLSPSADIKDGEKIRISWAISWSWNTFTADRIMPWFGRWMWSTWRGMWQGFERWRGMMWWF